MENLDPCWGHSTSSPSSHPSCSSTYSWLQTSWMARNSPSTLPRHTGSSSTSTQVLWPGFRSPVPATRTQSPIRPPPAPGGPQLLPRAHWTRRGLLLPPTPLLAGDGLVEGRADLL